MWWQPGKINFFRISYFVCGFVLLLGASVAIEVHTTPDEPPERAPAPREDVATVLKDGRWLMKDGSIRPAPKR